MWGLHPGFHRERVGEQRRGDVAGNAAPRAGGTITGEPGLCKKGPWRGQSEGKESQGGPGEDQGLRPLPRRLRRLLLRGANSFFGLAVGFPARTMGIAVVVPVTILYKQG